MKIGFLGLGDMGQAIVPRLLAAGHSVIGWNRTREKAAPMFKLGMLWADSPCEVAHESEIVFSIVTDSAAVRSLALGENSIIAGLRKDAVYLDMSTIDPDSSRAVAAEFAKAGLTMMDAPVSGTTLTLAKGNASLMVGGDKAAFERVQPVLLAIGPKVTYIGAQGLAVQLKVALNMTMVIEVIGFCEGIALAEKGGVPREVAVDAHKPLGWKLAFGGPAALERLRINAPLVGFLTDRALVPSSSTLSLSGWTKPAAEPEITVYLGKDLSAGSDRETTKAAIAALGPAIEVADVDHPSDDVEGTLACDIYQRHVILGRSNPARAGGILDGLAASILRNGSEVASITDPQSLQNLTGELIDIVRHTADLLAAFGESLQAGQIIIAGSIIPPIWIEPGEEIIFNLAPIDTISIRFAPDSARGPMEFNLPK